LLEDAFHFVMAQYRLGKRAWKLRQVQFGGRVEGQKVLLYQPSQELPYFFQV
jgi:hypothetical protein